VIGPLVRIRTLWYKVKHQYILGNVSFGPKTVVACRLSIRGPGKIAIGSHCVLSSDPWGGDFVSIHTHQPDARVIVGNRVVMRATRFGCHLSVEIGDGAVLECASVFDSDFHNVDAAKRDDPLQTRDRAVVVGEGSYIGCECICSKGTEVGRHAALLPGTVIGTKTVPDHGIVGGNPARLMRRQEPEPTALAH
jgi:carbonic anhydrase/acetyltransferase-like protein (isoleucine patch superfamily)